MREINWDKPLSDEDKVWLRQSGIFQVDRRIAENERRFEEEVTEPEVPEQPVISVLDPNATTGQPLDTLTGPEEEDDEDDYDEWKIGELRAEVSTRKIPGMSKAEPAALITALREYDRNQNQ